MHMHLYAFKHVSAINNRDGQQRFLIYGALTKYYRFTAYAWLQGHFFMALHKLSVLVELPEPGSVLTTRSSRGLTLKSGETSYPKQQR